jgi:DNA (cytosine-5)-methyltransferase 1
MSKIELPIVSLFCGPGGMDLGFRQEGFRPVLALDDSQAAVATYNFNDPRRVALKRDLSKLSGAELVALVKTASPGQPPACASHADRPRGVIGGPPCQSFSMGNRQKKRRDPRARLGLDFARLVQLLNEAFQLDFFVLGLFTLFPQPHLVVVGHGRLSRNGP